MSSGKHAKSGKIIFPKVLSGKILEFLPSKTIFSQGEQCKDVHYIEQGVVKLVLVSRRGRSGVLGFLGRGDFFGEACIGGHAIYQTSAITMVPSKIMMIERKKTGTRASATE